MLFFSSKVTISCCSLDDIPSSSSTTKMATMAETEKPSTPLGWSANDTPTDPTQEVVPSATEEKEESNGAYWRIFSYAGTVEKSIQAVAVVAAICSGAGMALQNLIFGKSITATTDWAAGTLSKDAFMDNISQLALYFVYLGIARFVLSYVYNTLFTYAAYRIVRNIRRAYLRAALSQDVGFFDMGSAGSIAAQASSNGKLIQSGISEKLGLTFQGLAAFFASFIVAFVTNWKLTLICLCIAPATIIVMSIVAMIHAGFETKILDIYSQANSFAEGVLASAKTVHAFGMRGRLVDRFDQYLEEAGGWGRKISPLLGILMSAEYSIIYLGMALAFWQGISMLARGEVESSGEIFTVLFAVIIATISITFLAPFAIDFSRASTAAAQLFKLIDTVSHIDPFNESGEQPDGVEGLVELENVSFAYPSRPKTKVLDDFTLKIPAGKVTALVGASGSGKSTIVGLLERWYNPLSGLIKLDGRPINELNLHWLRKNVRLVQQEPVLFQGTVFENIVNGLVGTRLQHSPREVQMARVEEAARIAFAHDFIMNLPQGYDTDIGERGGLLSGGQKQRIAIARSVVSQPKILLLDEATSALDPHAEGIVQEALDRAAEGRTTLVIAHKLATIKKADNIVVMLKGKIVEQGTHEGLIAQDGTYARLVRAQDLAVGARDDGSDTDGSRGTDSQDEGDEGAEGHHPVELTKTMTRYPTADRARLDKQKDRDDFQEHKHVGLLTVIARLVRATPELNLMYVGLLLGCVGAAAAFPSQAILMAKVVDVFTLSKDAMVDRGNFFACMFIVMAGGCLFVYFILGWACNTIAQTLTRKLRRQVFDNLLRQDIQFFDRPENSVGSLVSHVESDPQGVFELMGINVGLILISVLNLGACSILAIAHSWKLGLVVVLAGMPPLALSGLFKIRLDVKLDQMVSKRHSKSSAIASESINAIRTVSSLALEDKVLEKYTAELDHAVAGSVKPLTLIMTCFAFQNSIEMFFLALGFWYGCKLVSDLEISMHSFFVAFMGVFLSAQAASQFFAFSTSITKGQNSANYIFWLSELQPTVQETPDNQDKKPSSGGPIELDNVRFSYPLRPDTTVLRGVDLEIKKGQFIAVVGASGCGKSTIIGLLERFYDASTGTVRIASEDLSSLNPRHYRGIVSLVQQEPTLFQGSIQDNVALGLDESDMPAAKGTDLSTRVEAALRAANAWDFVCSLPDGVATSAGPKGTQISGGQKQRIAIARALIRNPQILLLDEATSALDTASERIVQDALAEAAKEGDRITVAVAHRLSTIKDADLICVFHAGKIVEAGTHASLVSKGGIYKQMCEAQNLQE